MDIRTETARYYDLNPEFPDDILFYKEHVPSAEASVLELGCGTGRVLEPLAECCGYICGIDSSEAMLALCRDKLEKGNIGTSKAQIILADISDFDLRRTFDLIIAPFRVFQNLQTDAEVEGLFRCVQKHLAPDGTCILNVFKPKYDPSVMRSEWCTGREDFCWEVPYEGGRVTCHDRRPGMDRDKLILYPELVYRRYEKNVLRDEVVLKIAMRCYYPKEFEDLILTHGFKIIEKWGGYHYEPYGQGPELVIQFVQGD